MQEVATSSQFFKKLNSRDSSNVHRERFAAPNSTLPRLSKRSASVDVNRL